MSKVQGNLTEGRIAQVLTRLALPIMASAFLATAYNITDMAWVGMLGAKAVAGVGVGGMYGWLAQGLASLARMGGQVHMGQALGRGDKTEATNYASASVFLAIVFGIAFGAVCLIFTGPLVSFFRLQDVEAIRSAKVYLRISCGCMAFSYIGTVLTGLYTAQGNSKAPLKANFIGLVINMILDPILILGVGPFPRLEAAGAAIATVLAQIIVVTVLVVTIWKDRSGENVLKHVNIVRVPEGHYVKNAVKMGAPTALQGTVYCGISMILSRMVGWFGDDAIAVQRVGGQIESISWNTSDGFAAAMNAFAAQNYGAGKIERVKKGYRVSAIMVFLWGSLVALAFLLFPAQISSCFFHEKQAIDLSIQYLRIIGVGEAFMCLELMAVGAISGLGNTKICSAASVLLTGMRIPLATLLSKTSLGLDGIWWALTISSISKGITMHVIFGKECAKKHRELSDKIDI